MLVSFSVTNFRSFRDEATLDLRAPRGAATGARPWDGNLQAVAGIYGANASGKTTLVRAIQAMGQQVRDSYRRSLVTAEPFAFDTTSRRRPTEWAATFVAEDGACYAYGFSVFNGHVVEEWAERYSSARATRLFERQGSAIRFGAALKGPNRSVEKTMRDKSLYLSAAAAAAHDGLAPVYGWFLDRLRPVAAHQHTSLLGHALATLVEDPPRRDRLTAILSRADLGLDGLDMEADQPPRVDLTAVARAGADVPALAGQPGPGKLAGEATPRPRGGDGPVPVETAPAGRTSGGAAPPGVAESSPTPLSYEAFGTHVSGGQSYRLPLADESDGTRAMLCHAFVIDEALRAGATVVFDEIDASLHPLLVRELVRTFQDRQLNPHQAQLVFTTHDVSLMDAGYGPGPQLSRDEVWVTEKDPSGASALVALADYSPRTRENLARRYLSGRYGGIPVPVGLVDPVLV